MSIKLNSTQLERAKVGKWEFQIDEISILKDKKWHLNFDLSQNLIIWLFLRDMFAWREVFNKESMNEIIKTSFTKKKSCIIK